MPATEREDAQTLLDAVWPVRNDFLRVDFRSYPSKTFKKGYAEQPFSVLAPQLKHVLSTRVNVTQIVGEEFLDMFNTKAKNGLHALCLKSKIGWEVWRKDTALAMPQCCRARWQGARESEGAGAVNLARNSSV